MAQQSDDDLIEFIRDYRTELVDRIVDAQMQNLASRGLLTNEVVQADTRTIVDAGLGNMMGWLRDPTAPESQTYFTMMVTASLAQGLTVEQTITSIDMVITTMQNMAHEQLGSGSPAAKTIKRRLDTAATVGRMKVASEAMRIRQAALTQPLIRNNSPATE